MRVQHAAGFTLVELMIGVVIVGILTAIAYPSYQEHIRKARRADAKSVLLQAAQWMERYYTENNRYDQDLAGVLVTSTTVGDPSFPNSSLTVSPLEGPTKYYTITLAATGRNTFTLNAAPRATGHQDSDKCLTLTLNQAGTKRDNSFITSDSRRLLALKALR